MLVSPVDEPLVNLIAEAESVVFDAEVCNLLELISGENLQNEDRNVVPFSPHVRRGSHQELERVWHLYAHLSDWIVGGVDDDGLCLGAEFTGELLLVKNPVSTCDWTFSRLL